MAALDHLVFASHDLDAGIDYVAQLTGVAPVAGGPHPGIGTRNALLSFDDDTYFEIIGVDRDQPDPDRERPFALDRYPGPRLAAYAIHPTGDETIDSVAKRMTSGGFDPGLIVGMSRVRPDGEELRWRLTYGEPEPPARGHLPFVIDWGSTESPARQVPTVGGLTALELSHPDAAVRQLASDLGLGLVVIEGPPRLSAVVESPKGPVRFSSDGPA